MNSKLIACLINQAGLTVADVARYYAVSKATVQSWLDGEAAPDQESVEMLGVIADHVSIETAVPMTVSEQIDLLESVKHQMLADVKELSRRVADGKNELAEIEEKISAFKAGGSASAAAAALRKASPVRIVTCVRCGTVFSASDRRAKFCGNACKQADKYARQKGRE